MRGLFGRFVQEDVVEDKTEYREPGKRRLKRQRQAYEEAERKDGKIESRGQGYMG